MRGRLPVGKSATIASVSAILALSLVVGIASAAKQGGKKLKTESATEQFDAMDDELSVTAACGQKGKAVSGGFAAEGSVVIPDLSERTARREWTAAANNFGGDPGSLTSYAYCRKEKVKSASDTEDVGEDETETATVRCQRGMKALSGGFDAEFDEDATVLPHVSRMTGKREWETTAFNYGDTGELTAQVNCRDGKGLKKVGVTETTSDLTTELVAKCERGYRVISGGFASETIIGKGGPFFQESRKQGKRKWVVSVLSIGGRQITAYAYCEKKKK
jgi:hypothetical protein